MRYSFRSASNIVFPASVHGPFVAIAKRIGFAILVIAIVAGFVRLDSDGYKDGNGDGVSLLDAFYYATVSVTTTGYGDIVPVTNSARVLTTTIVTIARVVFLALLVGTAFEVATKQGRDALTHRRWRKRLNNHIIVCGYGTKGRSAVKTLIAQGTEPDRIVVIDADREAIDEAAREGVAGIIGDATRKAILEQAGVERATSVIVAADRDAAAVLITLTARELAPNAMIASSIREAENAHLLRQSGANEVIISSDASGRLLGLAISAPQVVEVLEELLVPGLGLEIEQQPVTSDQIGSRPTLRSGAVPIALIRNGEIIHIADERAGVMRDGDQIVLLTRHDSRTL